MPRPEDKTVQGWGGRLDALLTVLENGFVALAMIFASILLFANVLMRYLFLSPIAWAEELTIYLMIWVVFIGSSAVIRLKGHLAIDLLPRVLSETGRRRLFCAVQAVGVAFFAALVLYGSEHTLRVMRSGQVMPVLQAPMWLAYLAVPVGAALMFIRSMQLAVTALRSSRDEVVRSGTFE